MDRSEEIVKVLNKLVKGVEERTIKTDDNGIDFTGIYRAFVTSTTSPFDLKRQDYTVTLKVTYEEKDLSVGESPECT